MRICLVLLTFFLMLYLPACSCQEAYGIGQAWQRNQCFKIDDAQERSCCLESANTSYQQYQRQFKGTK